MSTSTHRKPYYEIHTPLIICAPRALMYRCTAVFGSRQVRYSIMKRVIDVTSSSSFRLCMVLLLYTPYITRTQATSRRATNGCRQPRPPLGMGATERSSS